MNIRPHRNPLLAVCAAILLAGCAASGPPGEEQASIAQPVDPSTGYSRIVSGAADSAGWTIGESDGIYRYTFRMTQPASGNFTFRDRELTFYFRPAVDALHFQVENLKEGPVWIDWDRSVFYPPRGPSGKVAHRTTRWEERFAAQAPTQIPGFQRYGDYLVSMDSLLDPAGSGQQLRRQMFPTDETAQHFVDSEFGVDLEFLVEDRPRTYNFRFRVRSVVPR